MIGATLSVVGQSVKYHLLNHVCVKKYAKIFEIYISKKLSVK